MVLGCVEGIAGQLVAFPEGRWAKGRQKLDRHMALGGVIHSQEFGDVFTRCLLTCLVPALR